MSAKVENIKILHEKNEQDLKIKMKLIPRLILYPINSNLPVEGMWKSFILRGWRHFFHIWRVTSTTVLLINSNYWKILSIPWYLCKINPQWISHYWTKVLNFKGNMWICICLCLILSEDRNATELRLFKLNIEN